MTARVLACTSVSLSLLAASCKSPQAAPVERGTAAIPAAQFLDSIGVCSDIDQRGETLAKTIECARYTGIRWFRTGIEVRKPVETFLELHRQAGVRFSWSTLSGGSDLAKLLDTGRQLAAGGALLAFEGPNEPNNWGITYQGEKGGGKTLNWLPIAKYQRDLYAAVKRDPVLRDYPVWSISETGAQDNNAGLQYLVIPPGAGTLMPDGTRYADAAVCHNYIFHGSGLADNKTWNAADPTAACKVDGLYGNYGLTWRKKFRGHSDAELLTLPRVTTETGCTIGKDVTEHIHGLLLLSMYLDQFKRGWSHTAVYLLRDRSDESGNQQFGFYKPDYTPRKAALYLHNFTTILADEGKAKAPGRLDYALGAHPDTVHDLLLQKHDGTYALVVWNERVSGSDKVEVALGRTFAAVRVYDPTVGTAPVEALSGVDSLSVTLSDHPVVLELAGK